MDQTDIMSLLKRQVNSMEGGRRKVGRPRKRRGRGFDEVELSVEPSYMGMGLVGGRKVGRPKKPKVHTANMPPGLKRFWDKQNRKKHGRGLVGGSAEAQQLYEEALMRGEDLDDGTLRLLRAGIKPVKPKELLIKQIQELEHMLDLPKTSMERLKKLNMTGLRELYKLYVTRRSLFANPPDPRYWNKEGVEDDRFEFPKYNEHVITKEEYQKLIEDANLFAGK